ncbi:Bardet-Biedl syndrome 7 protein [Phytophthora cinnamomi]|uniref:Bardet-Biedl syndrome 7 protein n=1 Tax=Phytophthora cinnamomi TaxID=4785 RepID=UPI003559A816|nr:Bardet-Biedl syndrome 7 protein [Phytophthora cinnamomi]
MRRTCASLLEENQSLRVQLKSFDEARRRAEQQVAELRGRAHQAEVAAAQHLRCKEAEWMAEYDRGVQALLKIIQHHESETAQLRAEVGKLRATVVVVPPSITKMTRATQTDNGRPTKAMTRRNSVRFAPNENDSAVDKEESWGIDPKTKRDIARMQVSLDERIYLRSCNFQRTNVA